MLEYSGFRFPIGCQYWLCDRVNRGAKIIIEIVVPKPHSQGCGLEEFGRALGICVFNCSFPSTLTQPFVTPYRICVGRPLPQAATL